MNDTPTLATPSSGTEPSSALEALLGDFDFSDFPDEDQFPRQSGPMRELDL